MARYPLAILVTSLSLAVFCIYPISQLRWELQLQDTISLQNSKSLDYHEIEKSFGGLGSLTVILHSPDSAANYKEAKQLSQYLQDNPLVHFVEYETDIDFYKQHSLLYIENEDLDTIYDRLMAFKRKVIMENNPLFVDIANQTDSSNQALNGKSKFSLLDIEEKYFSILSRSHANQDGTIRVIDIYPKNSLSDLKSARALLADVQNFFEKDKGIEVYFTGKLYDTILTGRTLLPEAKFAGKMTALFILLLFIIHFYRQPQLILVSALPAGLPVLYTLALAGIIYGRINLFTLLLALFLPGQACQIITHVLNRYFIERNNNLGPQLSTESAVLGIGPSTAVSACIMSGIFATLLLVPVTGLQELGILGAIGSLLNWGLTILLTTSLLQVLQRNKPFAVNGFRFQREYNFSLLSYKFYKIFIAVVSAISLIGLVYGSFHMKFFYDFEQMEISHKHNTADSLLAQTGFPQYDPIIVKLPNQAAGDELFENFKDLKKNGKLTHLDRIYTLAQFSPKNQIAKKELLEEIKSIFTRDFLKNLDTANLRIVTQIEESLFRIDSEEDDTPDNLKPKFSDNQGNAGVFAFIFSKINPDNGIECRRLKKDLKELNGFENGTYKVAGTPVLRATFLDLILKNIDKSLIVGFLLIWFFLLLYYNRFSRAIFTLLPSIFAMGWLVFLLHIFNIELSAFSSLAFAVLFGFSVDGSLQLWTAYYEKQDGVALNVLQHKFFSVAISQAAALIGTYGLLISSHPGLKSIGQLCLLGLICISISQFFIFPLIAGSLDNYRLHKHNKEK
ncbi:MAG: RND transporter [Fibrobacter sp.]|nr:RND transporter [Fibrobacter sp.]